MPISVARIERERDHRISEEIGARSLGAVAERIADGNEKQIQLRIDGRRFPDASAVPLAAAGGTGNFPGLFLFVLRIVLSFT